MKKALTALLAVGAVLFFTGCGDDSTDAKETLELTKVKIANDDKLEPDSPDTLVFKVVHYKNSDGHEYEYKYCPNNELFDDGNNKLGTWIIDGQNVNITEAGNKTFVTNGYFEKGKSYLEKEQDINTTVTLITETICGSPK